MTKELIWKIVVVMGATKGIGLLQTLQPDILVNNAGINIIGSVGKVSIEDFEQVQQANLNAPFMLCQSVIGWMPKQG